MAGARTRRARRVAEAIPLAATLRAHGAECDSSPMTRRASCQRWFELTTPLTVDDRGDTPAVESNFDVAESRINAASAFGVGYRYDLWPGGTLRTLVVRADDAGALDALDAVITALENYPVLDDEDLWQREWDQNHPDGGTRECHADHDCGCHYRTHQHTVDVREKGRAYPWCSTCYQDVQDWNHDRFDPHDPRPEPLHRLCHEATLLLPST
ncbi:hypothetical protein [Nocardia miyunensis]|uniref:hypothetical protein n=1 Tax=Nocardia miyunensis TaxID=282684 RepID=UPI00082A9E75|nr:hypothetical protein [Nocardia miyunensis]